MTAKVKATGEIVNVYETQSYVEGWAARNANGKILFFNGQEPPQRPKYKDQPKQWIGCNSPVNGIPIIKQTSFPSVTWESEPLHVKLIIAPIEK